MEFNQSSFEKAIKKYNIVNWIPYFEQVVRAYLEIESQAVVIPDAEKLNSCADCGDRGWLYDKNGNRLGQCPCHF